MRHRLHVISALFLIGGHLSQLLFDSQELVVLLVSNRLVQQKLVTLGLHALKAITEP